MRRILRATDLDFHRDTPITPEMEAELKELNSLRALLRANEYRFRHGFSERTTTRLISIQNEEPFKEYYASLSLFFPRMAYSFLTLLALVVLIVFLIHGEVNDTVLTGIEKVDDSNFISYLLLQEH
jgi:hypothetical protein